MNPAKPLRPLLSRITRHMLPRLAQCLPLVTVFLSTGCESVRLRRDIQRIMDSRIVLPQEVSVAQSGEVYPMPDSVRSKPKMIVYVDSTECTMCRISKFEVCYGSLYAQSKETGVFELVLLIRSGEVEGMPIARVVSDFEFGIPVYVDERNSFLKDNSTIPPSDSRLHSLFVDGEGKPVLVGDPALNGRVREMFEDKLNLITCIPEIIPNENYFLPKRIDFQAKSLQFSSLCIIFAYLTMIWYGSNQTEGQQVRDHVRL